jgi:hypothetical protein
MSASEAARDTRRSTRKAFMTVLLLALIAVGAVLFVLSNANAPSDEIFAAQEIEAPTFTPLSPPDDPLPAPTVPPVPLPDAQPTPAP